MSNHIYTYITLNKMKVAFERLIAAYPGEMEEVEKKRQILIREIVVAESMLPLDEREAYKRELRDYLKDETSTSNVE